MRATAEQAPHAPRGPVSEPVLEAQLSSRWALKPLHVLAVALCGSLFLLLNYLPLRGTDLWPHVNYGDWILDHGRLPDTDPFMRLSEGVSVVDSAWLSQVLFAAVTRWLGDAWLSHLFALLGLLAYTLFLRAVYLRTGSLGSALLALLAAVIVGWSRISTIRPESFGVLAFTTLLWLIARTTPREGGDAAARTATREPASPPAPSSTARSGWIGIPLVMALWANLHGSFVCGLALLGCVCLGRALEVWWRTGSLLSVPRDGMWRRWLWWTELAAVATLLNPYGLDLWLETLHFAGNSNLRDIIEWQPLVILGVGGREFAASWIALLVAMRLSRAPVTATHVLLLAVFAAGSVVQVRMLGWYGLVFAWVMAPHLAELCHFLGQRWEAIRERWRLEDEQAEGDDEHQGGDDPPAVVDEASDADAREAESPAVSWAPTLICALLAWVSFALAPISQPVLGGKARAANVLLGPQTPLAVTEYLKQNPTDGLSFNPQYWGDWIVRRGPPGYRPMVTSNVHLIPRQVWQDYMVVQGARPGWDVVLDRYHIDQVVVDQQGQAILSQQLEADTGWRLVYQDLQANVFRRVLPREER